MNEDRLRALISTDVPIKLEGEVVDHIFREFAREARKHIHPQDIPGDYEFRLDWDIDITKKDNGDILVTATSRITRIDR